MNDSYVAQDGVRNEDENKSDKEERANRRNKQEKMS